jgi:hypothetical protein
MSKKLNEADLTQKAEKFCDSVNGVAELMLCNTKNLASRLAKKKWIAILKEQKEKVAFDLQNEYEKLELQKIVEVINYLDLKITKLNRKGLELLKKMEEKESIQSNSNIDLKNSPSQEVHTNNNNEIKVENAEVDDVVAEELKNNSSEGSDSEVVGDNLDSDL